MSTRDRARPWFRHTFETFQELEHAVQAGWVHTDKWAGPIYVGRQLRLPHRVNAYVRDRPHPEAFFPSVLRLVFLDFAFPLHEVRGPVASSRIFPACKATTVL